MHGERHVLIYSDVDGTLIDDFGGTSFAACRAAAEWAQVILASSRTVVELARLQDEIGLTGPVLAENGAIVAVRSEDPMAPELPGVPEEVTILGSPWRLGHLAPGFDALHTRLKRLAPADRETVARAITAARGETDREAKARWHSILLHLPTGPERQRIIGEFRAAGLRAEPGGHWIQLVSDADKGRAAVALTAEWTSQHGRPITAAIGDESNDISLFGAVDHSYVVNRPGLGHLPELLAVDRSEPLEAVGVEGWAEMSSRLRRDVASRPRAARSA